MCTYLDCLVGVSSLRMPIVICAVTPIRDPRRDPSSGETRQ